MIIAIDGPAGAGKSTVTKKVAKALGYLYLDTGAMYRAITYGLVTNNIDLDNANAVAAYTKTCKVNFTNDGKVCLNGDIVDEYIRTPEITGEVWRVANNSDCRPHLVSMQQEILAGIDSALEGRDTTTVICPNAELKIYLDASPEERARRRVEDWADGDKKPNLEEVIALIKERDDRDMNRDVGALKKADDAVILITDNLSADEVIEKIVELAKEIKA